MLSEQRMAELEDKIGYTFQNKDLLRQAVTHSSYANEQKINKTGDYERLEFLGDAVLELVSSEFIYRENPQMPEGQLTRKRSSMNRRWRSVRGRSDWKHLFFWEKERKRPAAESGIRSYLTLWRR